MRMACGPREGRRKGEVLGSARLPGAVIETFRPLLEAAAGVALVDPKAARAELERRFDPRGKAARDLAERLVALLLAIRP